MSQARTKARIEHAARKKRIADKLGANRADLIIAFEDTIAKGLKKDATGKEVMQTLTAALTGFIRSRPAHEHVKHVDYVAGKILAIVPQTAPPEVIEAMAEAAAVAQENREAIEGRDDEVADENGNSADPQAESEFGYDQAEARSGLHEAGGDRGAEHEAGPGDSPSGSSASAADRTPQVGSFEP